MDTFIFRRNPLDSHKAEIECSEPTGFGWYWPAVIWNFFIGIFMATFDAYSDVFYVLNRLYQRYIVRPTNVKFFSWGEARKSTYIAG